jgi:hypothetical protein
MRAPDTGFVGSKASALEPFRSFSLIVSRDGPDVFSVAQLPMSCRHNIGVMLAVISLPGAKRARYY